MTAILAMGGGNAHAEPSDPVPQAPRDLVDLRDGTSIGGHVLKQEPGQFVIILTEGGQEVTLPWSVVAKVTSTTPLSVPTERPETETGHAGNIASGFGKDGGDTAPAPLTTKPRRRSALVGAGAALLSLGYAVALGAGAYGASTVGTPAVDSSTAYNAGCSTQLTYNLIPLVGTFVAGYQLDSARNVPHPFTRSDCVRGQMSGVWAAEIFDGLFQIGGIALTVLGSALPVHQGTSRRSWVLVPTAIRNGFAVSLVIQDP